MGTIRPPCFFRSGRQAARMLHALLRREDHRPLCRCPISGACHGDRNVRFGAPRRSSKRRQRDKPAVSSRSCPKLFPLHLRRHSSSHPFHRAVIPVPPQSLDSVARGDGVVLAVLAALCRRWDFPPTVERWLEMADVALENLGFLPSEDGEDDPPEQPPKPGSAGRRRPKPPDTG